MSAELTKTIEALGQAFAEFKSANEERLKLLEKGHTDPVADEKLNKLNQRLDELSDVKKRLEEVETKANRPGEALGDNAEGKAQKQHTEAFESYLRRKDTSKFEGLESKAMRVGSEVDGGFFVPATMSNEIVKSIFETSPIRQVANVITISTDRLEGIVDKDEAGSGWVGEEATRSETDTPQVAMYEIPVHEQYAEPRVTQKLLDDAAFNVEGWLGEKIADKFARTENTAFITGNGEKRPRGLLSYDKVANASWTTANWGSIAYIATGAAGDWAASDPADKLYDVVYSVIPEYLAGAAWMMRRAQIGEIRKFQDGQGNYLWQPGLQAGQPNVLCGYPIVPAEDMPTKAANSYSVAFGNFRAAYQIVDRIGIRVLRDPYTTKGYVKFYSTKRVGGGVINFQAFKVMKFAAS